MGLTLLLRKFKPRYQTVMMRAIMPESLMGTSKDLMQEKPLYQAIPRRANLTERRLPLLPLSRNRSHSRSKKPLRRSQRTIISSTPIPANSIIHGARA